MVNLNIQEENMTGHSSGVTPGYIARVRRSRLLDRLGREADRERVKAEITVMADRLIAFMGKDEYLRAVDVIVPDDATYAETRDELRSLLEMVDVCNCNGANRDSCPACQAAATEGLDEGEIPCL